MILKLILNWGLCILTEFAWLEIASGKTCDQGNGSLGYIEEKQIILGDECVPVSFLIITLLHGVDVVVV
jgi:hypothetical protein